MVFFELKKYTKEQLIESIKNYKTVYSEDPDYRKDPANFFGRNDQYFIDYLPQNFEKPSNQATFSVYEMAGKYREEAKKRVHTVNYGRKQDDLTIRR